MTTFHGKPPQLAIIAGKIVMSGNCTDVIGGTMTAGTFDGDSSGLITWTPPFKSAPTVMASLNSGGATTTSPVVRITGVGVGTAYVTMGESPLSGFTVGIIAIGEAKL